MDPKRWGEIERLYHLAREREAGEREKFLAEACGGDESLRQEVESLLARPPKAQDFLEAPALEVAAMALAKDEVNAPSTDLTGRTIAHYRVLEKIGDGGMGVVYRGHDSRLKRDVAIKVLPDVFAGDSARKARFEREARLLATLSHPNIAAIYDLEEAEGKPYLILELVEGKTLAERLKKGRIPLDETLGVCRQIAEGLEAAHEKGIIHRDLKPENIELTPEGKVKILDFGLAKAFSEGAASIDLSKSPVITDEMTAPGIILGTAAYMSPEQAQGKPTDKRTDIWAFGCVLYECLTGKRAFQGDTITETMASILKSEPDWALLPAETPAIVRSLLRRCLQKEPGRRLHDIADARIEMQDEMDLPTDADTGKRRLSLAWLAIGAAIILLAGILIGHFLLKHPEVASQPTSIRSVIKVEQGHRLAGMSFDAYYMLPTRTAMAISRDGHFIVYSAIQDSPSPQAKSILYMHRIDQMEAKPIPGTQGGIGPFLSPDDRWLGFWADGKLMRVPVDGGMPMALCDAPMPFGGSWAYDNSIVFSPREQTGLSRISADGGNTEYLTMPDKTKEEWSHRLPHCLPDGKSVLFTVTNGIYDLQPRIALLDLKTRKWRVLVDDAADARYLPTGHLVFLRQGTLMAVRFNIDRAELTGQPVPVVSNISQALNYLVGQHNSGAGQFSVSDSGWLLYAKGGIVRDWENSVVWVDQKGTAQPITSLKGPIYFPRLSPDGQRIVYSTMGREWRVWLYNLARGTVSRLIDEGKTGWAVWTRDGKGLIFGWWGPSLANLFLQPADESSPMRRLTTSEYLQVPGSSSPDGAIVAFAERRPDTGWDILLLDLRSGRVWPFLNSQAEEWDPEFSPDGLWLAYSSNESRRMEVYVRAFPGPGGKLLVSSGGGDEPLWSRDGKHLYYRWGGQVWVVDVRTDADFAASKPRLLFDDPGYCPARGMRGWDISINGQQFLMVKLEELKPQPITEMILVQNWFEELKRLAPTGMK